MLERGLAYEMDGHVELDFAEDGLRCRMDLPFASLECEPEAILVPPSARGPVPSSDERSTLPARPGAFVDAN